MASDEQHVQKKASREEMVEEILSSRYSAINPTGREHKKERKRIEQYTNEELEHIYSFYID